MSHEFTAVGEESLVGQLSQSSVPPDYLADSAQSAVDYFIGCLQVLDPRHLAGSKQLAMVRFAAPYYFRMNDGRSVSCKLILRHRPLRPAASTFINLTEHRDPG